ncbi:MAG: hypothetical protein IT448_12085 [Phycisphaerales bacterium]|nr:hypothetical protein [Phycisphaerales bacterium]
MACFFCSPALTLSPIFKTLSRAAAKSAKAQMRKTGLLRTTPDIDLRKSVCHQCPMRKVYAGVSYCGSPLLRKINRDPVQEGCGCPIDDKAADPREHCPITYQFNAATGASDGCNCRWCSAAASQNKSNPAVHL